ncbi:4-(cytidine 5'-diphospho)-2-C-methyl-D-erythritol kinase [Candidatus Poriferisodalis sp.]|uniref:4-(cytidine 5'-diphospho)-2-C-methyl-D-erythritol kinase n=1 Tax=Candidatus Poriferisodalis sp. TaxID=3101277 RepID=UPI003B0213F5
MSSGGSAPPAPVRLLAPAKLTLTLRITGDRADGYHLIDAEMVTLDLCDEVIIHPSSTSTVKVVPVGGRSPEAPDGGWDIPAGGDNLVMRALELVGRTAHVEVRKRIPPGAGLGGGSADAAAVLRWANRLARRAGSAPEQLVSARQAASLGADVAFCLVGGRAHVSGIGEIVEPLGFRRQSFVLWTPPIEVDTATVYGAWDKLGGPSGPNANDLELAALAAYPGLRAWRDDLEEATGRTPQLAGSGGTWFVPAPHGVLGGMFPNGGVSAVQARTIGRL